LYQYIIWYISLCVGDCLVCRSGGTGIPGSHLHVEKGNTVEAAYYDHFGTRAFW